MTIGHQFFSSKWYSSTHTWWRILLIKKYDTSPLIKPRLLHLVLMGVLVSSVEFYQRTWSLSSGFMILWHSSLPTNQNTRSLLRHVISGHGMVVYKHPGDRQLLCD